MATYRRRYDLARWRERCAVDVRWAQLVESAERYPSTAPAGWQPSTIPSYWHLGDSGKLRKQLQAKVAAAEADHSLSRAHGTDRDQCVLSGPMGAHGVHGDYRTVSVDSGAAVYDLDGQHAITGYELRGRNPISPRRQPESLRAANRAYRSASRSKSICPNCRRSIPRIPHVWPPKLRARRWQRFRSRAAAMEQYLKTRFGYTLKMSRAIGPRSARRFSFSYERQGHCEYFGVLHGGHVAGRSAFHREWSTVFVAMSSTT